MGQPLLVLQTWPPPTRPLKLKYGVAKLGLAKLVKVLAKVGVAKLGLAKLGKTRWPNFVLAKVGKAYGQGALRSRQSRTIIAQGHMFKAGAYVQCRGVRSMQGRTFKTGPYVQCRAACPRQGRTFNAEPYVQCRAACPRQGRTFNAEPFWLKPFMFK